MSDESLARAERIARADPSDAAARERVYAERMRRGEPGRVHDEMRAMLLCAARCCTKARRLDWDTVNGALVLLLAAPFSGPALPGDGFAYEIRCADFGPGKTHGADRPAIWHRRMVFMAAKFQVGGALYQGAEIVARCATFDNASRDFEAAQHAWPPLYATALGKWAAGRGPRDMGEALRRWREYEPPVDQFTQHYQDGTTSRVRIPRLPSRQPRYQKVTATLDEMRHFLMGAPSGEIR